MLSALVGAGRGARVRARERPRRPVVASSRGTLVAGGGGGGGAGGTQPDMGSAPATAQRSQRVPAKPSRQRHSPLFASHCSCSDPSASHAHAECSNRKLFMFEYLSVSSYERSSVSLHQRAPSAHLCRHTTHLSDRSRRHSSRRGCLRSPLCMRSPVHHSLSHPTCRSSRTYSYILYLAHTKLCLGIT